MREFLILTLLIIAVIFLAPMIVGLIIFALCVAAIAILLARLGLLPGFRYVRFGGGTRANRSQRQWNWYHRGRNGKNTQGSDVNRSETKRDGGGWYQNSQDGEEITLPETALRKENDRK